MTAARRLGAAPAFPLDGPLAVHATFTLRRPATVRRPTPATRPDLDHLIRAACDALTQAGAITDDGRIVELFARKTYPAGDVRALDAPGLYLNLYTVAIQPAGGDTR